MTKLNKFLLVIIVIGIGLLFTQKYWVTPFVDFILSKETTLDGNTKGYRWTGKISAVDTSCFFDGVCSVTVGGKKVIVVEGMKAEPTKEVGSLLGVESISDIENKIGKQASVFADKNIRGEYTLYGSRDYYIEI